MKKTSFFIIVSALIFSIAVAIIPLLTAQENYSYELKQTHSFTTAVCNEKNFCEDYEVTCSNEEQIGFRATGFSAQFSREWKDPRSDEQKVIGC